MHFSLILRIFAASINKLSLLRKTSLIVFLLPDTNMNTKVILSSLLASCLLAEAAPAFGQYANKDIAVYYLLSPTNCAKRDQAVQFYPVNLGVNPINQFQARVYKNGELLFTEDVQHTVYANDWGADPVRLQNTVHLDYEEEADVSMKLVLEGDEDPTNDSTTLHIAMPTVMDYPFTWTSENSRVNFHDSGFGSVDWQYDENYDAYYMSDRGTNWMGTLSTDALVFPEGEPVKCSFEYGTSGGDVTLYFTKDYGDNEIEIDTLRVGQSIYDFSPTYFTFKAKGPAIVKVTATLGGEWNASGSIYLRNICFSKAAKDLVAKQILNPIGNSYAIGTDIHVSARFANPSPEDIANPTFCYDAGWGVVREVYQGTIAAGTSLDFTFGQSYRCETADTKELKVWCETEGDSDTSNDLLKKEITYYEAMAFPYRTTFDEDNEFWTAVDGNGDGQTFVFEPMANNDMAALFSNYAANELDEQLVSPSILIPEGKHRVDFNFACFNQKGEVCLKLYLSDGQSQQLLFERDLDSQLWQTGYQLFDIPADGIYYFVFTAQGEKDAVVIDNFKVDDGEDLGVTDIHFDTTSGYNLTTTTVTISYANFGLSAQENVELGYSVNNQEMVIETNPAVLQPGDTVTYTFQTLADLSTVGVTYDLYGILLTHTGDEDINDYGLAWSVTHLAAQQLPYFCDFNDEERNAQWLMQSNLENYYSGWETTYMSGSYSTMGALKHSNWDEKKADSWAYSEGIQMSKGQYEVSFFHHEADWFSGPDYLQSFEVKMGQERTPEGMDIEIDSQKNVDIYTGPFEKIIKVVNIPTDGVYYLGFHNTSNSGYGYTIIDDIRIEALTQGRALPYASDFAGADSLQWTFYDPNDWYFLQWQNVDGTLVADRTEEYMWYDLEGMVVSPKLRLEANRKVNVKIAYDVQTTDRNLTLNLYGGETNNNATMTLLAELPADANEYTYQLETGAEAKDFFVGFRSNTARDGSVDYSYGPFYTLSVTSVKVEYDESEAIGQILNEQDAKIELYDMSGRLVASGADAASELRASGEHGVFILRITAPQGVSAQKIEVK